MGRGGVESEVTRRRARRRRVNGRLEVCRVEKIIPSNLFCEISPPGRLCAAMAMGQADERVKPRQELIPQT